MIFPEIKYWAGTPESFSTYLAGLERAATMDAAAYGDDDEQDDEPSRLLTKQGNVAVISVTGGLVPGAPWYAKYAGITGYDEIRQALVQAANDPDIGGILLDVNSGGGAVNGVTDVADLIRTIDAGVKPVHTYSSGMMASAALWLGSSARRMDIGRVAEAGSIGVLVVHQEMTKMMERIGITPTIVRSGEYKAMGHSMEVLSAKAKEVIQAGVDQVAGLFTSYIAERRGVSSDTVNSTFGEGRVFIGERAVAVGLVDGIATFDAVISKIQRGIDSARTDSQYGANFSKGPVVKTALTEQQVAALAEGGGVAAPEAGATTTTAQAGAGEGAATGGEDADDSSVAADAAAAANAAASEEGKTNEVVAFLKGQLAESQASVLDLTVKLRDAEKGAESLKGTHAAMRAIAVASVDRLKVALGGSAGAAEALSDEALLAEHASLRAQFETKFKAGGVAAVTSTGSTESTADTQTDALRMARIKSTRTA